MERAVFAEAITRSGGVVPSNAELDRVIQKIAQLEQAGGYNRLLQQLRTANDKSNFLSTLLEATFASQYEGAGIHLAHEVKQAPEMRQSVDFRHIYGVNYLDYELRLVQQDVATTEQIKQQLDNGPFFAVSMGATAELRAIGRAQNIILSKIQCDKDGTPVKFAAPQLNVTNIVVVDTHDLFLGGIDVDDCRLISYGDPAVPEENRRGAFGLFQDYRPKYGEVIRNYYDRFAYARATVHGVMFLFRAPGSDVFDYSLRQFTMWNPAIMNAQRRTAAMEEIQKAVPFNEG